MAIPETYIVENNQDDLIRELKEQELYEDMEESEDDTPECFGTGSYACGSEMCDWCPYEQECGFGITE